MTPHTYFAGFSRILRIIAIQHIRSLSTSVFLGCAIFSALSAIVTTVYAEEIMSALVNPTISSTLSHQLPSPSWSEAYTAWLKNLNQILVLGGIILVSIFTQRDFRSGSLAFMLTRFLSRPSFALAHFLVSAMSFVIIFLIGALTTGIISLFLFDHSPLIPILSATLIWGLIFCLISAAIYWVSGLQRSLGLNILVGLGMYFLFQLGGMWSWAQTHTPLGLSEVAQTLAHHSTTNISPLPILSSILVLLLILCAYLRSFSRAELHLG